ncbi:uncharacterized protein V1518DRAFT_419452 [Limtongia smithiae]|uniref:uncharacterized protein n=1 Tax=Limtongia smithiae TaxID=1125753 RepID=UPI0034CE9877
MSNKFQELKSKITGHHPESTDSDTYDAASSTRSGQAYRGSNPSTATGGSGGRPADMQQTSQYAGTQHRGDSELSGSDPAQMQQTSQYGSRDATFQSGSVRQQGATTGQDLPAYAVGGAGTTGSTRSAQGFGGSAVSDEPMGMGKQGLGQDTQSQQQQRGFDSSTQSSQQSRRAQDSSIGSGRRQQQQSSTQSTRGASEYSAARDADEYGSQAQRGSQPRSMVDEAENFIDSHGRSRQQQQSGNLGEQMGSTARQSAQTTSEQGESFLDKAKRAVS